MDYDSSRLLDYSSPLCQQGNKEIHASHAVHATVHLSFHQSEKSNRYLVSSPLIIRFKDQ